MQRGNGLRSHDASKDRRPLSGAQRSIPSMRASRDDLPHPRRPWRPPDVRRRAQHQGRPRRAVVGPHPPDGTPCLALDPAGSAAEAQGQSEDEQQGEHEVADTGVIDVVEEVHAEGHTAHGWHGKAEGELGHLGRQESSQPAAHAREQLVGEKKAQERGFQGARTPPLRCRVQNDRRTWGADGPSEQP